MNIPIACDMTGAADTPQERLAEYRQLFDQALVAREKTAAGVRFTFREDPGIEAWVRDLTEREKACCPFFSFDITVAGGQVLWDASVVDDKIGRGVLEEFLL